MFDYYGGKTMQGVKFYKAKYIIVWDEGQHKTLENGYLGVSGDTVTGFFTKIPKNAPAIDITAQWAEYKVDIFNKSLYDFESLRYNTDKVLSSEEIFIEKKNKKGLIKKTDVKKSIKSYRFEDESLFIVLKTGQSAINKEDGTVEAGIPALRADVLMNLIASGVTFNIKRTRFFDKDLQEL